MRGVTLLIGCRQIDRYATWIPIFVRCLYSTLGPILGGSRRLVDQPAVLYGVEAEDGSYWKGPSYRAAKHPPGGPRPC